MMTGPAQHFYSSILDAWPYRVSAKLAEREGFGELRLLIETLRWELLLLVPRQLGFRLN